MEDALQILAGKLGEALAARGWLLGGAESCTGGLLSSILTDVPGASAWYVGAVVSYANDVKRQVLGVPQEILDTKGAVSRETVLAMVRGARHVLGADVAVAVSGVAGPAGGTPQKPVGTVWLAWEGPDGGAVKCFRFDGDRQAVRLQSVREALTGLLELARAGSARDASDKTRP